MNHVSGKEYTKILLRMWGFIYNLACPSQQGLSICNNSTAKIVKYAMHCHFKDGTKLRHTPLVQDYR